MHQNHKIKGEIGIKQILALAMIAICTVLLLTGCKAAVSQGGQSSLPMTQEGASAGQPLKYDRRPMVRVGGELYLDTGKESDIGARCGMMDGEITSSVDGTEIPTQDDQSNFGVGFGYQYVDENSIDLLLDNKWIRFVKESCPS